MKKKGTILYTILFFASLVLLNTITALPDLSNLGVTYDTGNGPQQILGNSQREFFLLTNDSAATTYAIQFTNATTTNEALDTSALSPFYLTSTTVSTMDLQNYYSATGLPQTFIDYLNNATVGVNPFFYLNRSSVRIHDAAQRDINATFTDFLLRGNHPSGSYTYRGELVNATGAKNNVTLTFIVGISFQNKTDVSCAFESDNITLETAVIGMPNATWISYTIGSVTRNVSIPLNNNNISYLINKSDLLANGGQNFTWNVFANDSLGRVYNNSAKTFYVRARSDLTVSPSTPDGEMGWYVTEPTFTLSKDASAGSLFYRWDSDDTHIYTTPFQLENIPNQPNRSAGLLDLHWNANFGVCGNESEQEAIFRVDMTNPEVTARFPVPNSTINETHPQIRAYIDEVWQSNSGVNKSSIIMLVDGAPVTPIISDADTLDATVNYTVTGNGLTFGQHNVTLIVSDNAGRTTTTSWSFSVVLPASFNLTINMPTNVSYATRRVPFNISTSQTVDYISYIDHTDRRPRFKRLCRNCDSYGLTRKRVKPFKDGTHIITIKADNSGAINMQNITFTIDSRKPKIRKTFPRKNDVINGSIFSVEYTEANLEEVTLHIVSSTNNSKNISTTLSGCTSGKNVQCQTGVDLGSFNGEEIIFWFTVKDSITTVASRKTRVIVDTTVPVLTINLPQNTTNGLPLYTKKVPINLTASEEVKFEYIDLDARRPRFRKLCTRCTSYGEDRFRSKRFSTGNHTVIFRATDKSGNSDMQTVFFTVSS